ncbi:MAG: trigger factor [bacterium]
MGNGGADYLKQVKSPGELKRILEFEVPRERVQAEIETIIQGIRRDVALPGFRKGKAPADLVRARFAETARKEAIDRLIPEAYEQALEKEALRPVLPAQISDLNYDTKAGPLSFQISIELFPKIEIKPYTGVAVKKETVAIGDDHVERELGALRERMARFEKVDGEVGPDLVAVMDYWRVGEDGGPVKGSRVANYPVEIGSGKLVKEFEQGLVGTKAGETKTIDVVYPEDFPDEGMRGKSVKFGMEVKQVARKILPELNDEFAKAFKTESVEELRRRIKEGLERSAQEEAVSKAKREILRKVIDQSLFEVPDGLVRMALESLVKSYREEFEARGGADKDQTDARLSEIEERMRPLAVNLVKEQFIVDEIAKRESIVAKDEEIEEILSAIAVRAGIPVEEARSRAAKSDEPTRWRRDIVRNKVLDFLYQKADLQG